MVKVYYFIADELSKLHDGNQAIENKDEASCSSKHETVEKPKNSHSTHSKVRMILNPIRHVLWHHYLEGNKFKNYIL